MNEPQNRTLYYIAGAIVLLSLLVLLGWLAFRESSLPAWKPAIVAQVKPFARHTGRAVVSQDDLPSETPVTQPDDSVVTNAAVLYRQAFALYDALSKEEKELLGDWRTNVDASVEAELCGKIRPICNLMHQAGVISNCDWGIEPLTFDSKVPHIGASRRIARTAIWNAAHCRFNDVTGATDDALATLRLGRHVSQAAVLGCLVDMAIQNLAMTFVASNLGLFRGADSQRLAAAFDDPVYDEAPSRAMEQEAKMAERWAARWAALSPAEFEKELSDLQNLLSTGSTVMDRATALAELQAYAESTRRLAKALVSGSQEEYDAWLRDSNELKASSQLFEIFGDGYDDFVNGARRAEVRRAMVVAGLAIAQAGSAALQSHPDPATGEPFIYTETADGFELQSGCHADGAPLKMQFK